MSKQKTRPTWNLEGTKTASPVRLSQCMIVKNEEKNIERALAWAKDVAFEQIVVDTGSTDRTVEIAKRMGARVYHFKWIKDFAAAKNYAIEQAQGNWIAFLDADEYFSEKDTKRLMEILVLAEEKGTEHNVNMLRTKWAHLNDEGRVFMINEQTRLFKNEPYLRYHGAIHEQVIAAPGHELVQLETGDELTIFHTGYANSAYKETGKEERNITMLRAELEKEPDNLTKKAYLAESMFISAKRLDALPLFKEILASDTSSLDEQRMRQAYVCLLIGLRHTGAPLDEREMYARRALDAFPDHYDYLMHMAFVMHERGEYSEALRYLERCEEKVKTSTVADSESYYFNEPELLYTSLLTLYQKTHDMNNIVRSIIWLLRLDRYRRDALTAIIALFSSGEHKIETDRLYGLLSGLYDFTQLKDKLMVLKSAKLARAAELERMVYALFTKEEKKWLEQKEVEAPDPRFTKELLPLMRECTQEALFTKIKESYLRIETGYRLVMERGVRQFGYWGPLDSAADEYGALREHARVLGGRADDFIWLYEQLADARSKNVLHGVLRNLVLMDFDALTRVKDKDYPDYFDQELIFCNQDEVFVDAGAYNGDTAYSYLKTYERCKKIYCYEPTPELYGELCGYMEKFAAVEPRPKALGDENATLYLLRDGGDGALNRVVCEETDTPVDVVRLDDDIREPVSFIKLDVEGMEKQALLGAARHIREEKPKLAISVYHRLEDIVDIPRLVLELNPNYALYLRYYGGNLLPTELVLLAVDIPKIVPET